MCPTGSLRHEGELVNIHIKLVKGFPGIGIQLAAVSRVSSGFSKIPDTGFE